MQEFIVIVSWVWRIVSQLYSIYFLSFDSHDIYYLFKHRQIKHQKRITSLNKAVTHELSASIFLFLFKKEKKAGFRSARILGRVGPAGRQAMKQFLIGLTRLERAHCEASPP